MSKRTAATARRAAAEHALRKMLRDKAIELGELLRSREFLDILHAIIEEQIGIYNRVEREARRRKPSREWQQRFHNLGVTADTFDLSGFAGLKMTHVATIEQMLTGLMRALRGQQTFSDTLDPLGFVALMKRIFVPQKKRGRKGRVDYDAAFQRRAAGEGYHAIAREMDPRGYERDPEACVEKFKKASRRRLRLMSKAEGM